MPGMIKVTLAAFTLAAVAATAQVQTKPTEVACETVQDDYGK